MLWPISIQTWSNLQSTVNGIIRLRTRVINCSEIAPQLAWNWLPNPGAKINTQYCYQKPNTDTNKSVPKFGTKFWYRNLVPKNRLELVAKSWYQNLVPNFGPQNCYQKKPNTETKNWYQILVPNFGARKQPNSDQFGTKL